MISEITDGLINEAWGNLQSYILKFPVQQPPTRWYGAKVQQN
jgi:hypothetical protein